MKITMYELLGMVKDGKAPESIKYRGSVYYISYREKDRNKVEYVEKMGHLLFNNSEIIISEHLNDEVEILEEKEICHNCHKYPAEYNQTWCEFCLGISKLEEEKKIPEKLKLDLFTKNDVSYYVCNKINEVIDYLKSKGE